MTEIRRATSVDGPLLVRMLGLAVAWRAEATPPSAEELMATPDFAKYVAGWPARGDLGFVAEYGEPVGAAWWRFFTTAAHGYGFVDEATPELSIAVVPAARGVGVGSALLEALLVEAQRSGLVALSLSVEHDNPARRLYRRFGFVPAGIVGGADTMVLSTAT